MQSLCLECLHAAVLSDGQGPKQFLKLGTAFVLSAAIGLEREIRRKSAGLRTYTLVGTSAALFLLISKYGFSNVLTNSLIVLDPSRVAAQVVTGISFIGAGLIFVQGDRSKGLPLLPLFGSSPPSAWPGVPACLGSPLLSPSPISSWRCSSPCWCV